MLRAVYLGQTSHTALGLLVMTAAPARVTLTPTRPPFLWVLMGSRILQSLER